MSEMNRGKLFSLITNPRTIIQKPSPRNIRIYVEEEGEREFNRLKATLY
jgi:hypothetical protein